MGELTERIATVYARHFSTVELNAGTAFFRSPVGQKLLVWPITLADLLNSAHPAVEPERLQAARSLVNILKQIDPFIAALGNPPVFERMPAAGDGADALISRTDPLPETEAARHEKLAALYGSGFTVEELNTLIAFFRSPFGQRKASVEHEHGGEIANLTAKWFEPIRAELETKLAEELEKGEEK